MCPTGAPVSRPTSIPALIFAALAVRCKLTLSALPSGVLLFGRFLAGSTRFQDAAVKWALYLVLVLALLSWSPRPSLGGWPPQRATGPVAQGQRWSTNSVQQCHPAVCKIRVLDKDGRHSIGTGTLTWKDDTYGLIMSCEHVVRDRRTPTDIVVSFPSGQSFRCREVTTKPGEELSALLIAAPPGITPVEIFAGGPTMGEPVRSVGQCRASAGRVIPDANTQGWLVVSGHAQRSDSGGPILNAAGKLLGVLWGVDSYENPRRISGSSCTRIRAFLCDTDRKILPWHAKGLPCPCPGIKPKESLPDEQPAPDDLAAIRAELAALRKLVKSIEQGPKGADGATGERGLQGEAGQDGKSPAIDIKAIIIAIMAGTEEELAALAKALPPIYGRPLDPPVGEKRFEEIHLGEHLPSFAVRRLDVATNQDKVEDIHLGEGFTILNFPPE